MTNISTDISQVSEFLNDQTLTQIITRTQKGSSAGASVTTGMMNDFTGYLFVSLAYPASL